VQSSGFRIERFAGGFWVGVWGWSSGFRVWGLRFQVLGFGFWGSGFGFRVSGYEFLVLGFGLRVSKFGFGFRVPGIELRILGFRG
jgi:hypothetical protein